MITAFKRAYSDYDLLAIRESAIDTIEHLSRASVEAMIDRFNKGAVSDDYWEDQSQCGCFAGTAAYFYANERIEGDVIADRERIMHYIRECPFTYRPNSSRISRFFLDEVRANDTPETNEALKLVVGWMRDYLAELPE